MSGLETAGKKSVSYTIERTFQGKLSARELVARIARAHAERENAETWQKSKSIHAERENEEAWQEGAAAEREEREAET